MAIIKDIEIGGTGVIANYHNIENSVINRRENVQAITVTSYLNKEARQAGKAPVFAEVVSWDITTLDVPFSLLYEILKTHEKFQGGVDDI